MAPGVGIVARPYSTDIAEAWRVVRSMRSRGWGAWMHERDGVTYWGFSRPGDGGTGVPGEPAHAICRAALLATLASPATQEVVPTLPGGLKHYLSD